MNAALTLLAGAAVAGWLVPGLLARADLRRRDPVPLIVAWLVSGTAVLLAAAVGVVLLLLPNHGPSPSLLAAAHSCWSAVQHGSPPRVEEVAGLVGVALLVALVARLVVVSARGFRQRGRKRQDNLAVLRMVARPATGDILWLAHDEPLAFSMTGRPGVVVATEGLTRHLDRRAVAAVLAHEMAHLTGRHHLLIAIADALRAAAPFVPLCRQAPRAIRALAELAADGTAARACGPAAVRTALLRVTRHDNLPSTSLAMARDAVALRLARLRRGPPQRSGLRRTVSCGLVGVMAAAVPFLAGTAFLLGIAVLTCPLGG
ncbi:M56 family metallopeptidase [Actinophytocola sp.]|uniref:M56 family metallopeptidase n=1 Tax=Actinophytocola sp. TaxID=1872138 RepID=UPI002ED675D2